MPKKLLLLLYFFCHFVIANAQSWTELGTGSNALKANSQIMSICIDKFSNVYAAGYFSDINKRSYVAKWNGQNWSELGTGIGGWIFSIALDDFGNLYAAGEIGYVAKWNGSLWSELGSGSINYDNLGINGYINSVAVDAEGNVYVGGVFTDTSNKVYVAKWNGSAWSELGTGNNSLMQIGGNSIYTVAVDNQGNIYAGGTFSDSVNCYVAKWNDTSWSELGGDSNRVNINKSSGNDLIRSLVIDGSGNIYTGGGLLDNEDYGYVAKWNGSNWIELGPAKGIYSNALHFYEAPIFNSITVDVLGNVYGVSSDQVLKWNGNAWSQLGVNRGGSTIQVDNFGNVYVAGVFTDSNGYSYVAKFKQPPTANGPTSFCIGDSVVLTAPGIGIYQWYNTGSIIPGATSSSYTTKESGSYTVSMLANGITDTSSADTVTVNPLPIANITTNPPAPYCGGDSITLYANAGAGLTYQWDSGDTTTNSSNIVAVLSVSVVQTKHQGKTITVADTFFVVHSLRVFNGTCSAFDSIDLWGVHPPTISNAGSNQSITIDSTTLEGNTPIPYEGTGVWSIVSGTGIFEDSASPPTSVTGLSQGANVFAWTISNGPCTPSSDTVTINVESATGVIFGTSTDSYLVHPNPFTDHTTIRINSSEQEQLNVSLTNLNGVVLYSTSQYYTNEDIVIGDNLPSGVYFAQVSYGSEVKVIKLVKI